MEIILNKHQYQFLKLNNDKNSQPCLKIWFVDFWSGFDNYNNFFTNLLTNNSIRYIVSPDSPEILFYSVFGKSNLTYTCKKILYTGENIRPRWDSHTILNIGFDYLDDSPQIPENKKYFRLPLWYLYINWNDDENAFKIQDPTPVSYKFLEYPNDCKKELFCCVVVSNGGCKVRNDVFFALNQYKKVDSLGSWNNNVGYKIPRNTNIKLDYISKYKFHICCENSSYSGYVTEKLIHAKLAGCVPIYWGDPVISQEFNPRSFINVSDFDTYDNFVNYIKKVDNDDILYNNYLKEPILLPNQLEYVKHRMQKLVDIIINM